MYIFTLCGSLVFGRVSHLSCHLDEMSTVPHEDLWVRYEGRQYWHGVGADGGGSSEGARLGCG